MIRRLCLALAFTTALTTAGAAVTADRPRHPAGGTLTEHTFTAPGLPTRSYWEYLPPGPPRAGRALLVFLHGCNVTAEQTAQMYGFDELAAQQDFVVVYPQQTLTAGSSAPLADGNGIGCWNWFLPQDQQRGSGEPGTIAGLTRLVMAQQKIDPRRVYVDGVSAGADMAVILGADYPDLYAAVGAVAGCAYDTCGDATGELTYQAMGAHARVVPLFVENGTADTLNNMAMATGLVDSWLGADDLADDGTLNGSVPRTPAAVDNHDFDQTPDPGSGDACIHNDTLTCPGGVVGFQGSYPYTVLHYDDATGCDVLDFWVVHGMEHAYPDTPGDGPYTDPLGPDVTAAAWRFFSSHPLNASKEGCAR